MPAIITILFTILLHSLWQLPLLYLSVKFIKKGSSYSPTSERSVLIKTLIAQWLISLVSFLFYLLPQNEKSIPAYFLSLNVETIASTIAFKLLLLIYVGFLVYKCIQQIVMLSGFRNLMSSLEVHQQTAHHDLIKKWNRKLKLRSNMRLCISEKYDTAFTFGFLRPIIVLPVSIITTLPPAQIESFIKQLKSK